MRHTSRLYGATLRVTRFPFLWGYGFFVWRGYDERA
jgi:hypothetical protein